MGFAVYKKGSLSLDNGHVPIPHGDTSTPSSTEGPIPDLISLLVTGWRHRWFLLAVTCLILVATVVYSFQLAPIYTAQVTILPKFNNSSNSLLGNLASIVGPGVNSEGSYELLYSKILNSDRILDRAISKDWRHTDFSESVSLFKIFGIDEGMEGQSDRSTFALKKTLRNQVIEFHKEKSTGYMVLKVNAPRDGVFSADLANYLVEQLDQFNREIQSRIASEQYIFISERLLEVEAKLQESEKGLTQFQKNNRSYTSSPELMQRFGEINREIQAQTAIWVELRRQQELAAIEQNEEKSSVDILDPAKPPVVKSKPQRSLYWAAGLLIGFAVGVILLFIRYQLTLLRKAFQGFQPEN